jgi:hypothetical protein
VHHKYLYVQAVLDMEKPKSPVVVLNASQKNCKLTIHDENNGVTISDCIFLERYLKPLVAEGRRREPTRSYLNHLQ